MGLATYALAGAAKGLGEGLVERARLLAEEAMASQERADRQAERMQDREWEIEDRDLAYARKGSSGGGSRKSSGGTSGLAGSTRLVGEYTIGGVLHGRDPQGNMVPYKTPDGEPVKLDGDTSAVNPGEVGATARTALRTAGIPIPAPEIMAEIEARIAAGETPASVIADLDVPEEVTNKAGTVFSRALGITPEDAPPDETAPGRPTGFRGSAPKPEAEPERMDEAPPSVGQEPRSAPEPKPLPIVPGIPEEAIKMLLDDPSEGVMREFDEIFGQGAAARVLGGSKGASTDREQFTPASGDAPNGGPVMQRYREAERALADALENPTDDSIAKSSAMIDRMLGEILKQYGGDIPAEWRDRLKAFEPFLPGDGKPDYSGYKWKNWPLGAGV